MHGVRGRAHRSQNETRQNVLQLVRLFLSLPLRLFPLHLAHRLHAQFLLSLLSLHLQFPFFQVHILDVVEIFPLRVVRRHLRLSR